MIPDRIDSVHAEHASELPGNVRLALEAHKQNLVELYSSMTIINRDEVFLERQAMQILVSYQDELIKALRKSS